MRCLSGARWTPGAVVAALALCLCGAGPAAAATLTVTSSADDGSAGTLRSEIAAAGPGDTITFAPSLDGQTITLVSNLLTVSEALTISGPGAGNLTISGNGNSGIFDVTGGPTTISGLTLTDAGAFSGTGAAIGEASGVTLTLTDDAITNDLTSNIHGGPAVGLSGTGDLTISGSTFSGNLGGVLQFGTGTVSVSNSTFTDNSYGSGDSGGALFVQGPTTVTNSTFTGNTAATGGAIYVQTAAAATTTITGSTFSGNSVTSNTGFNPSGGALWVQSGVVSVTNSTMTGNTASSTGGGSGYGGAIFTCRSCSGKPPPVSLLNDTIDANSVAGPTSGGGDVASSDGTAAVTAANTIIADGSAASAGYQNCGEFEISLGHNLSTGNCGLNASGDKINTGPKLGLLANNGGPTETMALLAGSPAIDAGDDSKCPATDQRGVARPQGPHCDIGAFEYQVASATHKLTVTVSGSGTVKGGAIACPSTCSGTFAAGTTVTLAATPASGSKFAGWGGACSGTGACTVTMSADQSVRAVFAAAPKLVCSLSVKSAKVTLKKPKKGKHSKVVPGSVTLTAKCNQAARGTLTGTVTAKPKRGKKSHTYRVKSAKLSLRAGVGATVVVKLPPKALAALKAGARESASFKLIAGSATARATIKRIKLSR